MSLGASLRRGGGSGAIVEFTLMKGPGYPGLSRRRQLVGISVSLDMDCFIAQRSYFLSRSRTALSNPNLISGVFYWLSYCGTHFRLQTLFRVLEGADHPAQTLFVFGAAAATLFFAREKKQRLFFAALTGFFLGWLWLTREEGIWILPAAILLAGAAAYRAYRVRRLRELAETLILVIAVFASIQWDSAPSIGRSTASSSASTSRKRIFREHCAQFIVFAPAASSPLFRSPQKPGSKSTL